MEGGKKSDANENNVTSGSSSSGDECGKDVEKAKEYDVDESLTGLSTIVLPLLTLRASFVLDSHLLSDVLLAWRTLARPFARLFTRSLGLLAHLLRFARPNALVCTFEHELVEQKATSLSSLDRFPSTVAIPENFRHLLLIIRSPQGLASHRRVVQISSNPYRVFRRLHARRQRRLQRRRPTHRHLDDLPRRCHRIQGLAAYVAPLLRRSRHFSRPDRLRQARHQHHGPRSDAHHAVIRIHHRNLIRPHRLARFQHRHSHFHHALQGLDGWMDRISKFISSGNPLFMDVGVDCIVRGHFFFRLFSSNPRIKSSFHFASFLYLPPYPLWS